MIRSAAWFLLFASFCCCARATPPEYISFGREQRADYSPDPDRLLRIWAVFVNQGDGLLIQLPPRSNYDRNPQDADASRTERVDVLVDGGSFEGTDDQRRIRRFINDLYGSPPIIEHAVISHHDKDHVTGLTRLLRETQIPVENMYHNGLASYRRANMPAGASGVTDGNRWMARVENGHLRADDIIGNLAGLSEASNDEKLQGIYQTLAGAVLNHAAPAPLAFDRANHGTMFINERESALRPNGDLAGVRFEVVWPLEQMLPYGSNSWSETINGNSVTFRLVYGDFQMLFTGDHNEKSEKTLLEHLGSDLSALSCDVLKVPHHGSDHAREEFFRRIAPVVSVVSVGNQGFQSKLLPPGNNQAWQHPSPDVVRWLGGPHRVYHTFVHERRFDWEEIDTTQERTELIERTHVLIETDGEWFRLVEIPAPDNPRDSTIGLDPPPTVRATRRGNGTRWIRAR